MTLIHSSTLLVGQHFQVDPEDELVKHLAKSVSHAGMYSDHDSVVNFYVSLKSKPLAILVGSEQIGKIATVQCLARVLVGGDYLQSQIMEGHPWSAVKGNVTYFTGIHTRFNSEKMLCLIEEAWQRENAGKVFLACMTRISPAELEEFFAAIAFQLHHGQIVRFGDVHFSRPIPFPPNLFFIGTMDITCFDWWDSDLLSNTNVIHWPEKPVSHSFCTATAENFPSGEHFFLGSIVRNEQDVYRKLHPLLAWQREPILPLFLVKSLFEEEGIPIPQTLMNEALTYLANSWSRQGYGLFHPSSSDNLAVAIDFAIAQTFLPRAGRWIQRSRSLQARLDKLLSPSYSRSTAVLAAITGQNI